MGQTNRHIDARALTDPDERFIPVTLDGLGNQRRIEEDEEEEEDDDDDVAKGVTG